MTGLLSSVSGQFGKLLLLGTFFPVVIFLVAALLFLVPLIPGPLPFLDIIQQLDSQWQVVAATFVAVVFSGILFNLNNPVIRLYEGYPWKHLPFGVWMTERHRRRWRSQAARWAGVRSLLREIGSTHPNYPELFESLQSCGHELNNQFPDSEGRILPTRLGNVICSFEDYSYRQYTIDAVHFWPRLVAVIPKEYMAAIDDAKAPFDFMLHSSLLSFILAGALVLAGVVFLMPITSPGTLAMWLIEVAACVALSWVFYTWAIGRAEEWGDFVRSAFDLYRWKVLKELGYDRNPSTREAEAAIWNGLYNKMAYGEWPRRTGEVPYTLETPAGRATFVVGEPRAVELTISRGRRLARPFERSVGVVLGVTNRDPVRPATNVVVTDTIPVGFDYVWRSARVDGVAVSASGTNPYEFGLGAISHGQTVTLAYEIAPTRRGA